MSSHAASDAGETLVELLISLAVIGIAMTGLLGGLVTGISSAGTHHAEANAAQLLASAGEALLDPTLVPYLDCATGGSTSTYTLELKAALASEFPTASWTATVNTVQYWANASGSWVLMSSPCTVETALNPDGTPNVDHLQLVTISVSGPGLPTSPSLTTREFLKRGS